MFGGDLGHAHYPAPTRPPATWLRGLEDGSASTPPHAILTTNGRAATPSRHHRPLLPGDGIGGKSSTAPSNTSTAWPPTAPRSP